MIGFFVLQGPSLLASDHPDDDEIDGDLITNSNNNLAQITDFDLHNVAGVTVEDGVGLNPHSSYTAFITVYDTDTINDLHSVVFTFYHHPSEVLTSGALTLNQDALTDATGAQFVAVWNVSTNAIEVVSGGAQFTWLLESTQVPSEADFSANEFTFELTFRISKVAHETDQSAWFFGAVIKDGLASLGDVAEHAMVNEGLILGTGYNETDPPTSWGMNFYGELTVTQTNVAWLGVQTGLDFTDVNSASMITGTTLIANGDYQTFIKSSDDWNALITQDDVERLISDFVDVDIIAFTTAYDLAYETNISTALGNIDELVDIPYHQANTIINAISVTSINWQAIAFELPQTSLDSNVEGAALVTASFINPSQHIVGQHFMIGYDVNGLTNLETAGDYALVGTEFRAFMPNAMLEQTQTLETGDVMAVDLYMALSEIFQNAHYRGTLTIQITNK